MAGDDFLGPEATPRRGTEQCAAWPDWRWQFPGATGQLSIDNLRIEVIDARRP